MALTDAAPTQPVTINAIVLPPDPQHGI